MNTLFRSSIKTLKQNKLGIIEDYFPQIKGNIEIRSTQDYHVAVVFPIPKNAQ